VFQDKIWARETWVRQEREKVEGERIARIRKQQQEQREKQEREAGSGKREAAEVLGKQLAKNRAAEQKRQEEQARKWQKILDDETKKYRERYDLPKFFTAEGSTRQPSTFCRHDG